MFGMGGSEIIVILIVALLFLGPDKLPGAAKTISKGIRDIKKQSKALQNQIESDETIGGAIKDLKSALRGDEIPVRRPPQLPKKAIEPPPETANTIHDPDKVADAPIAEHTEAKPEEQAALDAPKDNWIDDKVAAAEPEPARVTLPNTAGETDGPEPTDEENAELASLIKPASGTVAKGS
jgi:sec-independent protein translocase protein TatB